MGAQAAKRCLGERKVEKMGVIGGKATIGRPGLFGDKSSGSVVPESGLFRQSEAEPTDGDPNEMKRLAPEVAEFPHAAQRVIEIGASVESIERPRGDRDERRRRRRQLQRTTVGHGAATALGGVYDAAGKIEHRRKHGATAVKQGGTNPVERQTCDQIVGAVERIDDPERVSPPGRSVVPHSAPARPA